jgi:hypothetical protein
MLSKIKKLISKIFKMVEKEELLLPSKTVLGLENRRRALPRASTRPDLTPKSTPAVGRAIFA